MQNSTSSVQEIIQTLSTDTDNNRKKININSTGINLSTDSGYWNDYYVDNLFSDLINPKFREWYCREFYRLGKAKVEALAALARKGNHPQRYFSKLIKNA